MTDVTDADRKAAADMLDEISNLLDHNGIGQVADLIRDGEYDEHEATQAFARHRAETERVIVEWLREFAKQEPLINDTGQAKAREIVTKFIADAIERGRHKEEDCG